MLHSILYIDIHILLKILNFERNYNLNTAIWYRRAIRLQVTPKNEKSLSCRTLKQTCKQLLSLLLQV